jgi:hypothetical protein
MTLSTTVVANVTRRVEHLESWGHTRRGLSLAAGHRERWLSQALDLARRPRGWTLDMFESIAASLGEHPIALVCEGYNPSLAPPPDSFIDVEDESTLLIEGEINLRIVGEIHPGHKSVHTEGKVGKLPTHRLKRAKLIEDLLHELFAVLLDRPATPIEVYQVLSWTRPFMQAVRSGLDGSLELHWADGPVVARYSASGRRLSPHVTLYRNAVSFWTRSRSDDTLLRLVRSIQAGMRVAMGESPSG